MNSAHASFFILLTAALCSCGSRDVPHGGVEGLIPHPRSLELEGGACFFEGRLTVAWPPAWDAEREVVRAWCNKAGLETVDAVAMAEPPQVDLAFIADPAVQGEEAYVLEVDRTGVRIRASSAAGFFRAWTTLRKMMPVECEAGGCGAGFSLPGCTIEDEPLLAHRGLLLDGCRHFQDIGFVKQQVELLALHGMNVLHWHLTEDQGWRLDIPSRPALARVGAWRTEADGSRHGGFYSAEEVREVVAHAAARHIEVIPEIEMPGHSSAALAAYPELGCTGDSLEVPHRWGVFKDIYCAGNEETFRFLEEVVDEVVELFPGPRVHIGGDEAPKVRWSSCARCQRRMKEEGLANEEELQRWFIGRMGRYLASKGKTIIGWDEILEGGLPDGAAVQSWRGMGGAAEAVHLGADVVVSPTSHCYLDYPLRSTDLEEAYAFDPLPDSLNHGPGRIIGGEGNMWTEHAPQELVESKVYPRLTALAEVYWSGRERTGGPEAFGDFLERLDHFYPRLDALGVAYGLESPPFALETRPSEGNGIEVEVAALGRGVEGRGTWIPEQRSVVDSIASAVPFRVMDAGVVRMEVGRRGQWTGQMVEFPVDGHAAAFAPLELGYTPSPWYTGGGDFALVDGKRGTEDFRDGAWQATQGGDMVATVDLGLPADIGVLSVGVYLYQDAWIFLPESVLWEGSVDGEDWSTLAFMAPGLVLNRDDRQQRFELKATVRTGAPAVRYVRMTVRNGGACPDWHAAAGSASWVFLDEFVVREKSDDRP